MTFQRTLFFCLAVSATALGCRHRNAARPADGTGNTGTVTDHPAMDPAQTGTTSQGSGDRQGSGDGGGSGSGAGSSQ